MTTTTHLPIDDAELDDTKYVVPALQRGLDLLTQFTRETRELTGAELARRLDLPRASVFRMLHTLERSGYLERVGESNAYKLGLGVLRLGFEYLASMELTEHGRSVLEALRDACGFSAHLVVRDAREVVFVAKAAGHSALFHSVQVGARLPAHATVLGRLLLSDLSMAELEHLYPEGQLPRYTSSTPTTVAELKALIDAHRAEGYAISQSGFETGICTVAAPVVNDRDETVATVSITVPAQQIPAEQAAVLVPLVMNAAAQLTARISHLPARAWPKMHEKIAA